MEPTWAVFDAFQTIRMTAFEVDALASTRPIEFPVESPDDASGMFDTLTYTKGGAVLRMIEQWLGPEVFRDGIRRYLAAHALRRTPRRTTCGTRWRRRAGKPVRRIMDAWIFQPGYPAIEITLDGDAIRLTQRRFAPSLPDDETTWPVPLIVRQVIPDGERAEHVLVEAGGLTVPLAHPEALVVANAGSSAFVRTFYDDELRAGSPPGTRTSRPANVRASWTTRGRPPSRAARPCRRSSTSRPGSPARRRRRSGRRSSAGSRWCDRFLDGEPRERFRDDVRTLVRPALDRLGWDPRTRGRRARSRAPRRPDPHARCARRRPRDPGDGARGRGALTHGRRRRRVGRRRRGGGGRLRRRRGGVRGVPRADAGGADAAGAGPLPIRARAVPRPRSDGAAARARRVRGDPAPGRAVPAGACRGEPGPRGDGVAPRPRPLGRAVAAASRPPT